MNHCRSILSRMTLECFLYIFILTGPSCWIIFYWLFSENSFGHIITIKSTIFVHFLFAAYKIYKWKFHFKTLIYTHYYLSGVGLCLHERDESAWLFRYKPRLTSTFYVFDTRISLHNEFQNNWRFKVITKQRTYHLTITNVQTSDSGTY